MPIDIVGDNYGAMGEIDIVGDDDLDALEAIVSGIEDELQMVGAAPRRNPGKWNRIGNIAQRMAAVRQVNPNAVAFKPKEYNAQGLQQIGVLSAAIAAGASVEIEVKPVRPFKSKRFVIPSNIGLFFVVTDVAVAGKSMLAGKGEVPGIAFAENSEDTNVDWDTVNPGVPLNLTVKNTDSVAHDFRAFVSGLAVS